MAPPPTGSRLGHCVKAFQPGLLARANKDILNVSRSAPEVRILLVHSRPAGVKAFEPGLLARANRGILYVDEVNLLDDHLVDVLLDSAASGRSLLGVCSLRRTGFLLTVGRVSLFLH